MKGIKQAFNSIASKITNQTKGCVQCKDDDCAKCKGNQHSYNYVFGNDEKILLPDCFWFAEYYSAPDYNFDNWTINGNPFNSEIGLITGNASNSINPNVSKIIYDLRFIWAFTNDVNALPTPPTALNSGGRPTSSTWVQGGCELKCWELFVPATDVLFGQLYLGIAITSFIDYQAFNLGLIDVSNPLIINAIDLYYKSAFGSQASVTSIYDGKLGGYVVYILNTYENFPPSWNNQSLGTMTFNEVICV